jgi:hypothetical protein
MLNTCTIWNATRSRTVRLGTTSGPHALRDGERPARRCTSRTATFWPLTGGDLRRRVAAIYWGSSGCKTRRSAQAAGSRAPSAEVVVPVDPLHRDVLNVVEGTQGAGQKWAAPADGFGFEQPDRRLGRALAYASPIHPIDAATSSSTRVRQTRLRRDGLAAINRLNNPMRLQSTLGAPFGGYEANREIVAIHFSPDGSPDGVDSAGAVVISGGDCIISSSRRTWSCLSRRWFNVSCSCSTSPSHSCSRAVSIRVWRSVSITASRSA